jgi:ornithine carbamoyltransferase
MPFAAPDMFKEGSRYPFSMKRDLISMLDVKDDLQDIIQLSIQLKQRSKKGKRIDYLKRKTLGMIFEKPSTRTRVSF